MPRNYKASETATDKFLNACQVFGGSIALLSVAAFCFCLAPAIYTIVIYFIWNQLVPLIFPSMALYAFTWYQCFVAAAILILVKSLLFSGSAGKSSK